MSERVSEDSFVLHPFTPDWTRVLTTTFGATPVETFDSGQHYAFHEGCSYEIGSTRMFIHMNPTGDIMNDRFSIDFAGKLGDSTNVEVNGFQAVSIVTSPDQISLIDASGLNIIRVNSDGSFRLANRPG